MLLPIVVRLLQNFTLGLSGFADARYFRFNYSLDEFRVTRISVDHANTGLRVGDDGTFELAVRNFSLNLLGNASFNTVPRLIRGKGYGAFSLANFASLVKFALGLGPNRLPNVTLIRTTTNLNHDNVHAKFDGTNDIFRLADMVRSLVSPIIIGIVSGNVSSRTLGIVQTAANRFLGSLPSAVRIPGTDVTIDYGLLYPPVASHSGDYIPLAIAGTSTCVGNACHPSPDRQIAQPHPVPDLSSGKGSLQMTVSEQFLNGFLAALFDNAKLNLAITPGWIRGLTNGGLELNTDLCSMFMPELRRKYGEKREISAHFNVASPPTVSISSAGIEC